MSQPPSQAPPPSQNAYAPPPGQPQGYPPAGQPYYPPPSQYYPPTAGYAPPGQPPYAQGSYAPQYVPSGYYQAPPTNYGAPPGPPNANYYAGPSSSYPQQPPVGYQAGYAPPPGAYAPAGYPGQPTTPGVPSMPLAPGGVAPEMSASFEPPTVLYRDTIIHNPKYSGGLAVVGYTKDQIVHDINRINKAAGDEKKLSAILVELGPLKMDVVAQEFPNHNNKNESLAQHVVRKTSGHVEKTLLGLIEGPLRYDVELVRSSIAGLGTNESLLNEAILDHTPTDIALLDYVYRQKFNKSLAHAVSSDLSGNVAKLFKFVTDPNRELLPAPNTSPEELQKLLDNDVDDLYNSGPGRIGTNEEKIYKISTHRTHEHLTNLCTRYKQKHRKPVSEMIRDEFGSSNHDAKALLFIVNGAEISHHAHLANVAPLALRDAESLEDTMKGLGTKNTLLIMRVLRAQWSRGRMEATKQAYYRIYEKSLARRVKGETSGAFEDLLLAMIGPS
uniref:Annexin A4 n=1 Tax=Mycena chlorophos TaxID=658473 RepID=A0ABQ0KVY0_MYCCL|nr:annexin A4 [Mycena chlorophos]